MYQDIFDDLFQKTSSDIELRLTVSAQEAYSGTLRTITFQTNTICPVCQSQGLIPGFFTPKPCSTCNGQGSVPCQRQMQIRIPAGIRTGTRLHFPGEGLLGMWESARGDIYCTITVELAQPVQRTVVAVQAPSFAIAQQSTLTPPLSKHPPTSLLNTQLGQYHLKQLLGTGGFADVYLGQHRYLNTYAAIKVIKEQVDGQSVRDFITEAQTIAALRHPNIVRILDFGVEGTMPYLVMDYAPGGTLRSRHPEGAILPLRVVLPYVNQMAAALQHAHQQRIVHRDVKPANMLAEGQSIILSDFGIAVAAHRTQSIQLHDAVGTVSYMSPEQISGKPRPASDQYALAVVIYEWLSGSCPFEGGTAMEVAMRHINAAPPPFRAKNPTVTPGVERVILRALAKEPGQRFDTVQDFAHELEMAR